MDPTRVSTPSDPPLPDRFDLYEACVQSPPEMAMLLTAIHGNAAKHLGEDFAGTGDLARYWIGQSDDHTAQIIDLDRAALNRAGTRDRLTAIVGDVREPRELEPVDVLHAGNFSIGYMHSRAELVQYLARSRQRLLPRGVFVCDTYGGESAFLLGSVEKQVSLPHGRHCLYTWEQRAADPMTGFVTDVLHFRVFDADEAVLDLPEAFVYHWRLWSIPEIRDAMAEAGFARSAVYAQLPDAVDDGGTPYAQPIEDPDWLGDSFIVCVAGFAAR